MLRKSGDGAAFRLLELTVMRCDGFGGTLRMTGARRGDDWLPTVSSRVPRSPADHLPHECSLMCQEFNVARLGTDVHATWRSFLGDAYAALDGELSSDPARAAAFAAGTVTNRARWAANLANRRNKTANGVTASWADDRAAYNAQCGELDAATLCSMLAAHSNQHDRAAAAPRGGRPPTRAANSLPLTAADVEALVLASPRCPISRVPVDIATGPRRASVNRTRKGFDAVHALGQVEILCSLLNNAAGWTPLKWAFLAVNQGLVPLPPAVAAHFAPLAAQYLFEARALHRNTRLLTPRAGKL